MQKKVRKAIWKCLDAAAKYCKEQYAKSDNSEYLEAFLHQVNAYVSLADTLGDSASANKFYEFGVATQREMNLM